MKIGRAMSGMAAVAKSGSKATRRPSASSSAGPAAKVSLSSDGVAALNAAKPSGSNGKSGPVRGASSGLENGIVLEIGGKKAPDNFIVDDLGFRTTQGPSATGDDSGAGLDNGIVIEIGGRAPAPGTVGLEQDGIHLEQDGIHLEQDGIHRK